MLKTKTGVANFIFIQILLVLSLENRFCSRELLSVLLLKPLAYLVAYAIERNVKSLHKIYFEKRKTVEDRPKYADKAVKSSIIIAQ